MYDRRVVGSFVVSSHSRVVNGIASIVVHCCLVSCRVVASATCRHIVVVVQSRHRFAVVNV